jgi:hypothetical protein
MKWSVWFSVTRSGTYKRNAQAEPEESQSTGSEQWAVSSNIIELNKNSVNIVHSVNKEVNPHKDNYHYVGGVPHSPITQLTKFEYWVDAIFACNVTSLLWPLWLQDMGAAVLAADVAPAAPLPDRCFRCQLWCDAYRLCLKSEVQLSNVNEFSDTEQSHLTSEGGWDCCNLNGVCDGTGDPFHSCH